RLRRRQAHANALAGAAAATAAGLEQAQSERIAYVQRLRAERDLTTRQVAVLEQRAQAVVLRARAVQQHVAVTPAPPLALAAPAAPAPTPVPSPAGSGTLVVSSTGYSLPGTT